MDTITDITIGWRKGDKFAEVDTPHCRIKSRLAKLHEKFPDEFECYIENPDGSLYAKIPVKWVKISRSAPGRKIELTEEQKQINADRLRRLAEEKRKRKLETNQ